MAGLTNTGLEILRLPQILEDNRERAQDIFSDQVAAGDEVDVGSNTALGRMIGIVAPAQADLWEALQQVHNSFNPNAATGVALDNLIALSGITRLQATATTAQAVFTGSINTVVSTAAKVSSNLTQRIFSVLTPVVLSPTQASGVGVAVLIAEPDTEYTISYSSDGVNYIDITINSGIAPTPESIMNALAAEFEAQVSGVFVTNVTTDRVFVNKVDPFQVVDFIVSPNLSIQKVSKLGVLQSDTIGPLGQPANSITTILVPVVGWDSVYNPLAAISGRFQETDEELRERFRNSKFVQSSNIIEALLDGLRNVEGVTDVIIYENDTDVVNSLGIPPHSFMPIVLGGLTTTIAQAIWQNKPTGIKSFGDTMVSILDSQGLQHLISFRRPTAVPIYISMDIEDTGGMPGDAPVQIKQRILDYVKSMYLIGDDVIYSRFYTPANQIPGHAINRLNIGTTPDPDGTSNIVIDYDEVAVFSLDNITVNIV